MARNIKVGLDYFPFDVDFFQDLKIRKLVKYQGGKAVTVYALLLCNIYKEGYYMRWDEELPFIISEQSGYDEAYIGEVIKCCMNIGLLNKDLYEKEGILTSKGIQERYTKISSLCNRKGKVSEFNLISFQEKAISFQEKGINSEKSTQSKVKERKEKKEVEEKKDFSSSPLPTMNDILEDFFEKHQIHVDQLMLEKEKFLELGLKVLAQWELSGWKRSYINPGAGEFSALKFIRWIKTEKQYQNETAYSDRFQKRRGVDTTARSAEDYTGTL